MVRAAEIHRTQKLKALAEEKLPRKTRSKNGKRRGLWAHRKEGRDRGRRALINIGRPDLKRRGGELKGQADKHQDQGDLREAVHCGASPSRALAPRRLVVPVRP